MRYNIVQKEEKIKSEGFMQGIIALMFSQVVIKIVGLVYKLYLTNREGFGDAGNAIYSAGYQIYALLLTVSSLGVPSAIAKLISEKTALGDYKGADRIFKIAFVTFATLGFIGSLILFFGADYISNVMLEIPEAELTLVALSPAIFFVSIASVIRGYYNGKGNMTATAKSQSLEQIFKTVLTIIFVEIVAILSGVDTKYMAAGANLATTFATFLSFAYLYMFYKDKKKENISSTEEVDKKMKTEKVSTVLKNILYISIPITITSLLLTINKNIDSFTVVRGLREFMTEAEALVQYGILSGKVDTLTNLPLAFNVAFAIALVPAIASAKAVNDMKTVEKRLSFSLLATMILALPSTIGMIVFAQPILNLLFPNANEGALILQITSISMILVMLSQTANGALQGLGKVIVPAVALSIGVVIKLILNLILIPIPSIGINGATIATNVCHLVSLIVTIIVLRKNIKINLRIFQFIIKPLVATIIMSLCSYALYINLLIILPERICTVISLVVAVLIYLICLIVLKIFSKEEFNMIPYGQKIYSKLENIGIYKKS